MIKLIDVHKAFGPKKVLEGFSLEVNEGETMALIRLLGYRQVGGDKAHRRIAGAGSRNRLGRRARGAKASA